MLLFFKLCKEILHLLTQNQCNIRHFT